MARNKISINPYRQLISAYKNIWPTQEDLLHTLIEVNHTLETLQEFKIFINDSRGAHKFRYVRRNLFLGTYYVSPTSMFKNLNNLLDKRIDALTHKDENGCWNFAGSFVQAVTDFARYSIKHPKLILMLYLVAFSRSISAYNLYQSPVQDDFGQLSDPQTLNINAYKPITLEGIQAYDITYVSKDCAPNPIGGSMGAVCKMGAEMYYMKPLEKGEIINHFRAEYSRQLLKNGGIVTPKAHFFCMRSSVKLNCYYASEAVANMTLGMAFCEYPVTGNRCMLSRQALADKIGEHGIACLAVINTLIGDFHSENFGVSSGQLIVFDFDNVIKTVNDYLLTASGALCVNPYVWPGMGFYLSINNVKDMKDIYEKILTAKSPFFHPHYDLPEAIYTEILTAFIGACDEVIRTKNTQSNFISDDTPTIKVNNALRQAIGSYTRNELFPAHCQMAY